MSEMIARMADRIVRTVGPAIDPMVSEMAARAAIDELRNLPASYFSVLVRTFNMRDDEQHRAAARQWYNAMIDEVLK